MADVAIERCTDWGDTAAFAIAISGIDLQLPQNITVPSLQSHQEASKYADTVQFRSRKWVPALDPPCADQVLYPAHYPASYRTQGEAVSHYFRVLEQHYYNTPNTFTIDCEPVWSDSKQDVDSPVATDNASVDASWDASVDACVDVAALQTDQLPIATAIEQETTEAAILPENSRKRRNSNNSHESDSLADTENAVRKRVRFTDDADIDTIPEIRIFCPEGGASSPQESSSPEDHLDTAPSVLSSTHSSRLRKRKRDPEDIDTKRTPEKPDADAGHETKSQKVWLQLEAAQYQHLVFTLGHEFRLSGSPTPITGTLYGQLNEKHKEIRVIKLMPSPNPSQPIECELLTVFLDGSQQPVYDALSYCWGEGSVKRVIKLSGTPKLVTENLEDALRSLRYSYAVRVLWIDALCIDQDNVNERNHQVPLMREIYYNAQRVYAWLGPTSQRLRRAFSTVKKLDNRIEHRLSTSEWVKLSLGNRSETAFSPAAILRQTPIQELRELSELFSTTWWTRIWCVQEIMVASEAYVASGNLTLSFDAVLKASLVLRSFIELPRSCTTWSMSEFILDDLKTRTAGARSFLRLLEVAMEEEKEEHPTPLLVLSGARGLQASDTRDRVYGLLGLSQAFQDLQPDYSLSPESVYIETTRYLIEETGKLDVLYFAGTRNDNYRSVVPSWVPDWRYSSNEAGIRHFEFSTSYKAASTYKSISVEMLDDSKLRVQGLILDRVSRLGPEYTGALTGGAVTRLFQDLCHIVSGLEDWPQHFQLDIARKHATAFDRAVQMLRAFAMDITLDGTRQVLGGLDDWKDILTCWTSNFLDLGEEGADDKDDFANQLAGPLASKLVRTMIESELFPRMLGQRFGMTRRESCGMFPAASQHDDVICAFAGVNTPFLVRPVDGGSYQLIGPCYVNDAMDGDAVVAAAAAALDQGPFTAIDLV